MIRILTYLFLFISTGLFAQNYDVKLMSWNVLNWPNSSSAAADTSNRCPSFRTILNYVQPDVLVTMENSSATKSVPWFLDQVMNTGIYHYAAGQFINGYDTDNAIYYRDSLFDFISNTPINTSLRDINEFKLVYKATGDTFSIFTCHLKASQGYETQRAGEVADLRTVTNAFPEGTNFLVAGDFNIYTSAEPAYQTLLQDNANDDGNFLDVLSMTGTWNNGAYAQYHTQSTHYSTSGGFPGGGMDDRFDMILFSNGVEQVGGVYYMPGSYQNIGNDGNHYQDAINYGTNTAVPQNVADALFNTSDHLPVILTMKMGTSPGVDEYDEILTYAEIFPNPVEEGSTIRFSAKRAVRMGYKIYDNLGKVQFEKQAELFEAGKNDLKIDGISTIKSGYYLLSLSFDNHLINKKIIIIK